MKQEFSGNIYKLTLEFNKGYVYAEILDFSDVASFDGVLVQVYNLIDQDKRCDRDISEIISSGIMFGPVPINKYPNIRGKDSWKFIGKNEEHTTQAPFFKDYRGPLFEKDWSKLRPWYKEDRFNSTSFESRCEDYEDVRSLETIILNHIYSIKTKITMMRIIEENLRVGDFYNLNNLGERNMYIQIVNTYYPKVKANKLIDEMPIS